MLIQTRGNEPNNPPYATLHQAILNPEASFGGLWSLESYPQIDIEKIANYSYSDLTKYVFKILDLSDELLDSALLSYNNFDNKATPVSYTKVNSNLYIQNLFTGPTRAFKDMAMQPFGTMLTTLAKQQNKDYLILSATSGDTGPATLEALKDKEHIYSICIYPHNATSDVQRLQMTTIDSTNIKVFAIDGNFDDAQKLLKELLSCKRFRKTLENLHFSISATNSVNFGRIVFQIIYHIHSYIYLLQNDIIKSNEYIDIIVPSGNFGNALGAFIAKKMGVKINKITIATNQNCVLHDFITTGIYDISNRKLINTNSPAMDILKSSNVERVLFALFGAERTKNLMENLDNNKRYSIDSGELKVLQEYFTSACCNDKQVLECIAQYGKMGILIDPHTATGLLAYKRNGRVSIVCSTAEWSKFAPTIAKAMCKDSNDIIGDLEAIKLIKEKFGVALHSNIEKLFSKKQEELCAKSSSQIKDEIISWLESKRL